MNKGEYNGECNRTACSNTGAVYFNHSTRKHYCRSCASLINDANRLDAIRLYGHDLCLLVSEDEHLYDVLTQEGWVQTDASTNQYYKEIEEGEVYLFREDRVVNPETNEKVRVTNEMIYSDYSWEEIVDACEAFGYDAKQVDKWITAGEEIPLILECIFEMLPDDLMDDNETLTK